MSLRNRKELKAGKNAEGKKFRFSLKRIFSPIPIAAFLFVLGLGATITLPVWTESGRIFEKAWLVATRPYFFILALIAVLFGIAVYAAHSANKKEQEKIEEEDISKRFPLVLMNDMQQPIVIYDEHGLPVWANSAFRKKAPRDILLHPNNYRIFPFFTPVSYVLPESKLELGEVTAADLYPDTKSVPAVLEHMAKNNIPLRVYIPTPGTEDESETGDQNSKNDQGPRKPVIPADPGRRHGLTGVWVLNAHPLVINSRSETHANPNAGQKDQSPVHPLYFVVMTDETELQYSNKQYEDHTPMCAYITIDNLGELVSREQATYRQASAQIDAIINQWASKHEAVIKEFERDKYIVLFRHEQLEHMIDGQNFTLLNMVSEVTVGAEEFPATVSVGISKPTGTLLERERSAQMALDTALKRGGGQAIVAINDVNFSVYGGKEEYKPQTHSGVHTRVFAEKLVYQLKHCDNVIIMGHKNPDFDSIGSCAGIARLAMAFGKNVSLVSSKNTAAIDEALAKLKSLPEYDLAFVSKIEAMNKLPANTITICCDVNNTEQFEDADIAMSSDTLFIIDHHRKNECTPSLPRDVAENGLKKHEFLIVPSASSASELVAEILEHSMPYGQSLSAEEADVMLAGMLLDTKQFTRNTQTSTFSAALYLRNSGADPMRAQALFKTKLDDYKIEQSFGSDIFLERESIAIARDESLDNAPTKRIAAAKTADKLLNIKNIRASFAVAKMGNDVFISARSDGSINVQLIMEAMNGGGHYAAAATMLKEITPNDAITQLCIEIRRYFNEISKETHDNPPKQLIREIHALIGKKQSKSEQNK